MDKGYGTLAGVIAGHHGGLPDVATLKALKNDPAARPHLDEAVDIVKHFLDLDAPFDQNLLPVPVTDRLRFEMFTRMIFSCVVDADWLDTAEHFRGAPVLAPTIAGLRTRFESRRNDLLASRPTSPVDAHRQAIYQDCITHAADPTGIFRLAAPTGSGKTLASMGFALAHAEA
jgi:CRISPR-associated endonuclease/helicase Cas3